MMVGTNGPESWVHTYSYISSKRRMTMSVIANWKILNDVFHF